MRFLPPLNVSSEEIDEALAVLEQCLEDVFGADAVHVDMDTALEKGRAGS